MADPSQPRRDTAGSPGKDCAGVGWRAALGGERAVDGRAQGEFLLGDKWASGTDAQRAEFTALFPQLFGAIAFPLIRKNFEHLETIV